VRALLWPIFAGWAWAQPATVMAGTTAEGVALATLLSVRVGSASHWGGRATVEDAAVASVRLVGVGPDSHWFGGQDI
jgi:hypothetical protein